MARIIIECVTTELYFCFVNNFYKMSIILNVYEHILFSRKILAENINILYFILDNLCVSVLIHRLSSIK